MNKDELKELAGQKEREWRQIQEQRIEVLEAALTQKGKELEEQNDKFYKLKEDFKYNIKLLEDRDKELDNYEKNITGLRKQLSEKNAEISDLKIKMDGLRKFNERDANAIEETKKHYLIRLNQKQNEIEQYRAQKDAEVNKERNEIEKYKRALQLQIQDLQFDLDKQRNELKNEFDEVMRKREHEWRKANDDVNTDLLAKDLQIKLLNSEMEQLRESNSKIKESMDEMHAGKMVFERELKEKDWELKDAHSIKDAKIIELEEKIGKFEMDSKEVKEEVKRKFEEMSKTNQEKDLQIQKLKEMKAELEKQKKSHDEETNELKMQLKQRDWSLQDAFSEKETIINSLNDEIVSLKLKLNEATESNAKKSVSSDLSALDLRASYEKAKDDLEKRKRDIANYKRQLQESLEREQQKERDKEQISMQWQMKYEKLENTKFENSEELINKLNESRQQVLMHVHQLEDKVKQKDTLINALKSANPALNLIEVESQEFQLKEENENLKRIIKQMRDEMENLAEKIPTKDDNVLYKPMSSQLPLVISDKANEEFVNEVRNENFKLKEKNRELQSQIDTFVLKQKMPDKITDNTIINNHVQSLNETISMLRKEKVELTSFSKKQQTRLIHIEKNSSDNSEQLRVKQTQIETLHYELNSQTRRTTTEINGLKQRVADLELELNESRREADEYHKMAIEKNSEIASLELKVSELKMKLSTSGKQLNFGAQELFIQQLQDEIERLNKKLLSNLSANKSAGGVGGDALVGGATINEINYMKEVEALKTKLKCAAKHISQLIQEKQQLIEMSNQLRGEMQKLKQRNDDLVMSKLARDTEHHHIEIQTPRNIRNQSENKLQKLEDMQYDLTRQQLALAQRNMKSAPTLTSNRKGAPDFESLNSLSSENQTNQMSMSTVRSENLQEIWRIIDDNENNSILKDDAGIAINGKKSKFTPKEQSGSKTPRRQPLAINSKPTNPNAAKTKVRNYNIKND